MTEHSLPDDDWRDLAAEYALGLLTGEALADARRREAGDPQFRAEAARWRGRLAPLLGEVEEVAPPPSLWSGIERMKNGAGERSNVIELRRKVRRWQGLTAAATAIAAALSLVVFTQTLRRPTTIQAPVEAQVESASTAAPMVAMLGKEAGAPSVVASWDPSAKQLILAVPGTLKSSPDHAHELWIIPPGGTPKSLGTMPQGKQMHMKLAEAIARLLEEGSTIAISVEPPGGSPTGLPTGPVIASGALKPA